MNLTSFPEPDTSYLSGWSTSMIDRPRLTLALEQIKSDNWSDFEQYASAFFVSEFPNLRTMASPSGDDGRDAEIFSPIGAPHIALQYSVTPKWREKVRQTVKRLKETGRLPRLLIYATNQVIGAAADDLKAELVLVDSVTLDVRDRNYFLERYHQDAAREEISAELARKYVDPLLEKNGIIQRKAQALTPGENRAALVFLELQWADDTRDKGLTKTAFDALVRSALRDTDLDHRMYLHEIYSAVATNLPEHHVDYVTNEVDKALRRLEKGVVRSYPKEGTYCLTHEAKERLKGRLTELQVADDELSWEIANTITLEAGDQSLLAHSPLEAQQAARATIERFLMERGEIFVAAIDSGLLTTGSTESIRTLIRHTASEQLTAVLPAAGQDASSIDALIRAVERLIAAPSERVSAYLRGLSDAYTLRAFLRQTPDVQEAVRKMFSIGEVWLDTSVMLPLFAEGVMGGSDRAFQKLIASARTANLALKVTPGVVEEIERHMNRARLCADTAPSAWHGSVPYLLSVFVSRGYDPKLFGQWIDRFRGDSRPTDDIADYVREHFGIHCMDIGPDAQRAAQELRFEVLNAWQLIHIERRKKFNDSNDIAIRMAQHDADNYLGVIQRRQIDGEGALGYTSWWLTLDQKAFTLIDRISKNLIGRRQSPVMSADFLANYLAVGPLRGKVTGANAIPLSLDATIMEGISAELFELARKIRNESAGEPEYLIRRKVRDGLDEAKRRTGDVHARGLSLEPLIEEG
ncbi:MAG: hypothetical protein WBG22_03655 [Rhodanobacter sp.]